MLTWRNVSRVAQRNFIWSYSPVLKLYIKGFHFVDVMTCEMSHHIVLCAYERFSGNCILFDWHFGKQVTGNVAVIAVTECT